MKLLTLKQVKDITQIPESTLRKWSKENLFPAFKVGSSWRVDQEDLDIWLSDKKEESATTPFSVKDSENSVLARQKGVLTMLSLVDNCDKETFV